MICDQPIQLHSIRSGASSRTARAIDHQYRVSIGLVSVLMLATLSVTFINLL